MDTGTFVVGASTGFDEPAHDHEWRVLNGRLFSTGGDCPRCAEKEARVREEFFDGEIVAKELGWCGCGELARVDALMLGYLTSGDPVLQVNGDAGLLLAYIADDRGWTDHGGSIHSAWLTDSGRELLANLTAARSVPR